MTDQPFPFEYRRLSPESAARLRSNPAKPTRAGTAVELLLFGFFAATILIAAIALVITNTRAFKDVPSQFAAGVAGGRVNVLFIGMAGPAPSRQRVSTLTLLSLRPRTRESALIAIPPETWTKIGRFGTHRLGAADRMGVSSGYPGEGTGLLQTAVQALTGQQVHGVVRLDEASLASIVDSIGGVDVVVGAPFYEYRTKTRFRPGPARLDGRRAVLFSSPYVSGAEGEPAARDARQQELLAAILEKLRQSTSQRAALARIHRRAEDGTTVAFSNLGTREVHLLLDSLPSREAIGRVLLTDVLEEFTVRTIGEAGEALRPAGGDHARLRERIARAVTPEEAPSPQLAAAAR